MLHTLLLVPLEAALNRLIATDSVTRKALAGLSGQVIALQISDLNQTLYLMPDLQGIQLQGHFDHPADVTLIGTRQRLLQLVLSEDKSAQFFGNGIAVHGDYPLAQRLQAILADSQIDWHGLLASHIGERPANSLLTLARQPLSQLRTLGHNLQQDLDEFLHEESRLLPTTVEAQQLYDGIDQLREQSDRLHARIEQLKMASLRQKSESE